MSGSLTTGPFYEVSPAAAGTQLTPFVSPQAAFAPYGRGVNARAAEVVNVKDFGPCGAGVTDSAPAINAAFAYIRANQAVAGAPAVLVFPSDTYTVLSPINATSIRTQGMVIKGNGSTIYGQFTSGIVFDAFNSRFFHIRDLNIQGDGTATPSLGLAMGITQAQVADCHVLDNVWITGTFSLACAYFISTETSSARSMHFWNASASASSYCLIVDGQNHFGVSSTFAPQTLPADTPNSFNEMQFLSPDLRHSGGGHALWIGCASRHSYYGGYVYCAAATQTVVLWLSAASGGGGGISHLFFDVHQEFTAVTDVFLIAGPQAVPSFYGFTYRDQQPFASNSLFKCAAGITGVYAQGCRIEVMGLGNAAMKLFDAPSLWTALDFYVLTPNYGSFFNTPAVFTGRVQAAGTLSDTVNALTVTGAVKFGTYTAGVVTQAGYVTITDAGGTTRRLLVG